MCLYYTYLDVILYVLLVLIPDRSNCGGNKRVLQLSGISRFIDFGYVVSVYLDRLRAIGRETRKCI